MNIILEKMRRRGAGWALVGGLATLSALAAPTGAAPFTSGNIVVNRIGNGVTTLSSAAAAQVLIEKTTAGADPTGGANVITIPSSSTTANTGGLTDAGSSTANGHLNRSANGQFLSMIGIDAPVGQTSVAGTTAVAANRNIAKIDSSGTLSVVAKLTDAYSALAPRAAVSDTGSNFYMAGATNGERYADTSAGVATTSASIATGTLRDTVIASDASGAKFLLLNTQTAISSLSGFPTTGPATLTPVVTVQDSGAFVLLDRTPSVSATGLGGLDTLYVSDGPNGLKKFEWNGSSWATAGSVTGSFFGLTARIAVDGSVELFATTTIASNNSLVRFTDSTNSNTFGGSISGTATVLASAGANYAFRGVAFAPESASAGTIALSSTSYTVNESAGTASIAVNRTGGTAGAVSVSYATSTANGDTATADTDYTTTSGTLNFASGASTGTITVPITDDASQEGDETFTITLSNPQGGVTLGSPASAPVTIVDNDVAGTFVFGSAAYSVNENGGTATITVNRTIGSSGAASVHYATSGSSATAGSDYTETSGDLSFANGDTSKTFTVSITNDTDVEADETLTITLSAPTGGALLGSPNPTTLTIVSDDAPALLINEIDANPPGVDNFYEYVEIKGVPNSTIPAGTYFVGIEGDSGGTLGNAQFVVNLAGQTFGSNGLLVIKPTSGGHSFPAETTQLVSTAFDTSSGVLQGGTNTFAIVFSSTPITSGTDYDTNNDGVLEFPASAQFTDIIGWSDGGASDFIYGGVSLTQATFTPSAVTRFLGNDTPSSAAAFYCGTLNGTTPESTTYSSTNLSANFPAGGRLTPGSPNTLNGIPVANIDTFTMGEDSGATTFDVLANDTDADSDALTITAVTQGSNGSVINNSSNVSYTPNADFSGDDSFTYTISDGKGGTATGTVNVTVTGANDAPSITSNGGGATASVSIAEGGTGVTTVTASDVDSTNFTYSITGGDDASLFTIDNSTGVLRFVAAPNFEAPLDADTNNVYEVTVEVRDDATPALSDSQDISVTVTDANDAPIAVDDSYSTDYETALNINAVKGVLANDTDADGNPLTVAVLAGPSHSTSFTLNSDGSFDYTPATGFSGDDTFTYTLSDGQGASDEGSVTITVAGQVNNAPVATNDSYVVEKNSARSVNAASGVLANDTDQDGNTLTVVLISGAAHGNLILNANGSFTYTPNTGYIGSDSFTYKANDGTADSNTATVSFTVNAPPVVTSITRADANPNNSATVRFNVVFSESVTGVDSTDFSLTSTGLTTVSLSSVVGSDTTYLVTANGINGQGTLRLDVVDDDTIIDGLGTPLGGTGTANGNFSGGETYNLDSQRPTVTVEQASGQADPTTSGTINFVVTFNESVTGFTATDVTLSGTATATVNVGSFSGSGTTYTFSANATSAGTVIASVGAGVATDAAGNTNLASTSTDNTVTYAPNNAPVAVDDSYSRAPGTTLTVTAENGLLANDTDADGNTLVVTGHSSVPNASLTVNADGSFTFSYNPGFSGNTGFTYTISDGNGGTDTGSVTLTETVPGNNAPVAVNDGYSASYQTPLIVTAPGVLFNDTDGDSNPLTATLVTGPAHANTFTLNADGSFSYTPNTGYSGPDSFTYKDNDGTVDSNTATVSITVGAPSNNAPVAVNDGYSTSYQTPLTVTTATGVLFNDTDQDGNTLAAVLVNGPAHGTLTLNANGSFTYTPGAGFSGSDSFTYKANDGTADSNVATVSLTVGALVDSAKPTVVLSTPTYNGKVLIDSFDGNTIKGTAGDDVGVTAVKVRLSRKRGTTNTYWNGTDFVVAPTFVDAAVTTTGSPSVNWALTNVPAKAKLDAGLYSLQVYAQDAAGNKSTALNSTLNIVVDVSAPTLAISSPTVSQKILVPDFVGSIISGTATDDNGVATVRVRFSRKRNGVNEFWNGTDFVETSFYLSAAITGTTDATWTVSNLPGDDKLDAGLYQVEAAAVDAANNKSATQSRSFYLVIDPTAPTLAITSPTVNQKVLFPDFTGAVINGSASDNKEVTAVKVRLSRKREGTNQYWNGTDFVTSSTYLNASLTGAGSTSVAWTLSNLPSTGKIDIGLYQVEAYALDGYNNKSLTAKQTFRLSTDFTAATIGIDTPTVNQKVDINAFGAGLITGTAGDNVGVTAVKVKVVRKRGTDYQYWNGSEFTTTPATVDASYNAGEGTWSYDSAIAADKLDLGGYTVYASALDAAGNITNSPSRTFTVTGTVTAPDLLPTATAKSAGSS